MRIVLKCDTAFQKIRFLCYEVAEGGVCHTRRMSGDDRAGKDCLANHVADFTLSKDRLYVLDMLREGMKIHDPRL